MGKKSFRWPSTHPTLPNVLKAHGFVESNDPGDVAHPEADDFALVPGEWQWLGDAWIPFTPPLSSAVLNRDDLRIKVNALMTDPSVAQVLKDFIAALIKIL